MKEERKNNDQEIKEELKDWVPKTELGRMVLEGKIKTLDEVLAMNKPIMEPEIADYLAELEEMIVDVKKTARVTRAGRRFSFRVAVLVGNRDGIVGVGVAKDKEKWPAARKAAKLARLNLVKVVRGCGSWECSCNEGHSVPFEVIGKCASVRVRLIPAPKGVGLVIGDNAKPVLEFAGIQDVWSQTKGNTSTKLNFVLATIDALRQTTKVRLSESFEKKLVKSTK
jgi:small subunit ribosomal protein S5